jgi:reactive intermediate/imine deaminase
MTAVRHIETPDSPAPSGSYSQARVCNGLLFLAGVGPYHPKTRAVVGSNISQQTVQVVENIRAVLRPAGCDLADVVYTTAYLAELQRDWADFDATYGRFFSPPYPARTAVGAQLKSVLLEVAVVAQLNGDPRGGDGRGARTSRSGAGPS